MEQLPKKKLKILVLLSESWNDFTAPNNNMTNWFTGFEDVELATVSGSGTLPHNDCCKHYFTLSERAMMKSVLSRKKVGSVYHYEDFPKQERRPQGGKKPFKLFQETARLCRDFVWRFGRYDLEKLTQFIQEFNPDVVFSQRKGSVKMCRMEKIVSKITAAPMVAYTGDDEYSLRQFSLSPIFWLRRFWVRRWLKRNIPTYRLLYSQSARQMAEFQKKFGVETKFLVKCGAFDKARIHTQTNAPLQLVYAGKLYCNRWKSLALVADGIRAINSEAGETKLQLNIYTKDAVTKKQNKLLNDGKNSILRGAVAAEKLPEIYKQADVVMHVESFDLKNKLLTQDSFSTKVMDCLASGCATMAVCWQQHAAGVYLKGEDAALVANDRAEVNGILKKLADEPQTVLEYAQKAYACGVEKHERTHIQQQLREDFERVSGA